MSGAALRSTGRFPSQEVGCHPAFGQRISQRIGTANPRQRQIIAVDARAPRRFCFRAITHIGRQQVAISSPQMMVEAMENDLLLVQDDDVPEVCLHMGGDLWSPCC
jgi:hypothetical protein